MSFFDTIKTRGQALIGTAKFRLGLATVPLMGLVSYASAADLNTSVAPILEDVGALMVPLLALILAAIPLIIAISIIGFVLGILAAILGKLKV